MRKIDNKSMIGITAAPAKAALSVITVLAVSALFACIASPQASVAPESARRSYLGFDRNIYPGDDAVRVLRKTFVFTSYWLSPPPGENRNTWLGKRKFLRSQGFGLLVLYRASQT